MTDGAQRDQYGRFELLTLPLELTPRDVAHWSAETWVMFEMHNERGQAFDASHSTIDASGVAPYRLVEEYQDHYWLWASSDMRRDTDSLDCVETYGMRQEQVPYALYAQGEIGRPLATPIMLQPPAGLTYAGMPVQWVDRRTLERLYEQTRPRAPTTTRETIGAAHRRLVKRAQPPNAKPSRVPERFQKTRLDGRPKR